MEGLKQMSLEEIEQDGVGPYRPLFKFSVYIFKWYILICVCIYVVGKILHYKKLESTGM